LAVGLLRTLAYAAGGWEVFRHLGSIGARLSGTSPSRLDQVMATARRTGELLGAQVPGC
jgi:hypothetical protein